MYQERRHPTTFIASTVIILFSEMSKISEFDFFSINKKLVKKTLNLEECSIYRNENLKIN
jgi:hypothetical protein